MVNADLSQLFQYSPEVAGYFAGQNQASNLNQNDEQTAELAQRIAASQGAEARANQLQPYEVQKADLGNQTTSAALPGVQAKSTLDQIAASSAQQTQQSDVATKLATNADTQSKATFDQVQRAQTTLLQAGPMLSQTPAPLRKQALQSYLESQGIKTDAPHIQMLLNADPNAMPTMISQMADQLGAQAEAMSPQARAMKYDAKTRADAEVQSAGIAANSRIKAAGITAQGRIDTAMARAKAGMDMDQMLMSGKVTPDKAAVAASQRASQAMQMGDQENYIFWQNKASQYEQLAMHLREAGKDGTTQISPEGGLTPRTIAPVFNAPSQAQPPGTGQTSSGTKYQILTK